MGCPNPQASPVFVVGKVRSGTTLMSMMLSAHPSISIAPDIHYTDYWVHRYGHLDLSQPSIFDQFWTAFTRNKRFGYLGIDADEARTRIEAEKNLGFREVYAAVLEMYSASFAKSRWGEKAPFASEHLETLLSWFPDCRVLFMLRDPRAVVSSLRRVPWLDDVGVSEHARSWATVAQRAVDNEASSRVLWVRYESLVRDPVGVLREVCGFIGEDFSPAMVDSRDTLRGSALRNRGGWEEQHLRAALGPVYEESIDRWRIDLTAAEATEIERQCDGVMQLVGYCSGTP